MTMLDYPAKAHSLATNFSLQAAKPITDSQAKTAEPLETLDDPVMYVLKKMGNCHKNYQSGCYLEAAADFMQHFGMRKVLDIFEAEESKPQIFARCHEVTHYLGRLEYKNKQSIMEAYKECSPVCHGGCYHGVIEGYFLQKNISVYGNPNITGEILKACGKLEDYEQSRLYYECQHGIGHAMMLITGDELPDSLKLCDSLRNSEEREACYSGVFMESSSSSTNDYHTSKYTKADDPLYPCDILDDRYLRLCYSYQSSYFSIITKYSWDETIKLCNMVPEKYRDGCFKIMGSNQVGFTQNQTLMKDDCYLIKDDKMRDFCVQGVVDSLGGRYKGDINRIVNFCGAVNYENKESCYRRMGVQLSGWDQKNTSGCNKAEEKYKQFCFNAALSFNDSKNNVLITTPIVIAENTNKSKAAENFADKSSIFVSIKDNGFFPQHVNIPIGTSVTWMNEGEKKHWPASDLHPTHTNYPGSGIMKCGTEEAKKIFDSCNGLKKGETYTFKFNKAGVWTAHDHLYPGVTMTVEVAEKESKNNETAILKDYNLPLSRINKMFDEIFGFLTFGIYKHANAGKIETDIYKFRALDYGNQQKQIKELSKSNPAKAWGYLKKAFIVNGEVIGNAHELSHIIGNEMYKQNGFDGIKFCDPAFSFGCYHGVTEQMLLDKGKSGLKEAEQKCVGLFPDNQAFAASCIHGIGHGILTWEGIDINISLKDCDSLDENHRNYCYDGVFMENSFSSQKNQNWDFCAKFDERQQPSCALYLAFGNFSEHAKTCGEAPNKILEENCFRSLGYRAAQISQGELEKIKNLCSFAGDGENFCLINAAVETIFQGYQGWRNVSVSICEHLSGNWKSQCMDMTQSTIASYRKQETSRENEIQLIKKTTNSDEKSKLYLQLIKRVGPAEAQEDLLRSGLPFDGETHLLNHVVGRYLYENEGPSGLAKCKDYFLASCYHGLLIEAIANKGIEGTYEIMERCKKSGPTVISQCSHALGHGFLAWAGYPNLVDALKLCDEANKSVSGFPLFNCYDGIFMENIWAIHEGAPAKDNWVNYSDLFYPCNDKRIPYQYLGGCWSNQPTIMYRIFNGDVKKIGEQCLKVNDTNLREICFNGLARQIHPVARGNAGSAMNLCSQMPENWTNYCARIVATSEFSVGGRTLPFTICSNANDDGKKECYTSLFGTMSVYASPDEFAKLCGKISDAFWKQKCYDRVPKKIK